MHDLRDVGGTRGGLPHFLVGLVMTLLGGYLFLDRVTVYGGYWHFMGSQSTSFGITLLPLLFGIGMLLLQRLEQARLVPHGRHFPAHRGGHHRQSRGAL